MFFFFKFQFLLFLLSSLCECNTNDIRIKFVFVSTTFPYSRQSKNNKTDCSANGTRISKHIIAIMYYLLRSIIKIYVCFSFLFFETYHFPMLRLLSQFFALIYSLLPPVSSTFIHCFYCCCVFCSFYSRVQFICNYRGVDFVFVYFSLLSDVPRIISVDCRA